MSARPLETANRRGGELTATPQRVPRAGHAVRGLLRALVVALVLLVTGPAGVAMAEGLSVSISSPPSGKLTDKSTVSFTGVAGVSEEDENVNVTLTISSGSGTSTTVVQTLNASVFQTFSLVYNWGVVAAALPDGTYTAEATEENEARHESKSPPVTFTVDTTPPSVTIAAPANGSSMTSETQGVSGSAGVAAGDISSVTVQLFTGPAGGALREAHIVPVSNGSWSDTFGGLSPGTYTLQAEQADDAGNLGVSAPVTFTVVSPPPAPAPPPPAASFTWFPTAPSTGENVSLVSSSTDMTSPITAFAWGLTGTSAFQAGKPVLTTSFSTPGGHVVRLRVTAANGLSSIASETIKVNSAPLTLMQPFPIVRIAGSETFSGVDLRLLTAQAPPGSRITVTCKGHACPKAESQIAASSKKKTGTVTVEFRRFERALQAGVVLEIRIFKAGEIGKFTRFTVRHDKLPERDDACLGPTGTKPIVCPSS